MPKHHDRTYRPSGAMSSQVVAINEATPHCIRFARTMIDAMTLAHAYHETPPTIFMWGLRLYQPYPGRHDTAVPSAIMAIVAAGMRLEALALRLRHWQAEADVFLAQRQETP